MFFGGGGIPFVHMGGMGGGIPMGFNGGGMGQEDDKPVRKFFIFYGVDFFQEKREIRFSW
jgi:hypothetical protein